MIEGAPSIGTGLEYIGLGQTRLTIAHEPGIEERSQHLLPELLRRRRAKGHVPERPTGATVPLTVRPGSNDEGIDRFRAVLLDRLVDVERAVEVIGVEPSAHRHHRGANVDEMREDVALLPECIVGPVSHDRAPDRDFVFEILLVQVLDRSRPQIELVAVGSAEVDGPGRLGSGHAPGTSPGREIFEPVENERAVEVEVVSTEPVGLRRLR